MSGPNIPMMKSVREENTNQSELRPEIQAFIQEHGYLWWWMPEEKKKRLRRVSEIFFQQISGRRTNYHKLTIHFFKLYFQRHVQIG